MNEMNLAWDEAVLHVLGTHHPHEVSLQTIYFEVSEYRKFSEWHHEDIGYDEPRYKQIVRATLSQLVRKGLVERLRRGVYALKE